MWASETINFLQQRKGKDMSFDQDIQAITKQQRATDPVMQARAELAPTRKEALRLADEMDALVAELYPIFSDAREKSNRAGLAGIRYAALADVLDRADCLMVGGGNPPVLSGATFLRALAREIDELSDYSVTQPQWRALPGQIPARGACIGALRELSSQAQYHVQVLSGLVADRAPQPVPVPAPTTGPMRGGVDLMDAVAAPPGDGMPRPPMMG